MEKILLWTGDTTICGNPCILFCIGGIGALLIGLFNVRFIFGSDPDLKRQINYSGQFSIRCGTCCFFTRIYCWSCWKWCRREMVLRQVKQGIFFIFCQNLSKKWRKALFNLPYKTILGTQSITKVVVIWEPTQIFNLFPNKIWI